MACLFLKYFFGTSQALNEFTETMLHGPVALFFEAMGCFLFAVTHNILLIYAGLTLFLVGSCVITVSINIFIASKSPGESLTKKKSYLLNSIAMNVGILIGFIASGLFDISGHLYQIFILGGVLSLVNSIVAFTLPKDKVSFSKQGFNKLMKATIACAITAIVVWFILYAELISKQIIFFVILLIAIYLFLYLIVTDKKHRKNYCLYFSFLIISIVFWSVYFISPIILMPLIKHMLVDTHLASLIAPQWIAAVDPTSVILLTPIIIFLVSKVKDNTRQLNVSSMIFIMALVLISLAFYLIIRGFNESDINMKLYYFLSFIFIASIGELLIGPIGYSVVSDLCHEKVRGILMGLWISSLGMSSVIAGTFGKYLIEPSKHSIVIAGFPIFLAILSIAIAILFYLFRHQLKNIKRF